MTASRQAVRTPPRVWLLTGHKAGDNNQVLALAEALGWPFDTKRLYYKPYELISNRLLGATLAGIDRRASSDLQAPWPDLVITAGRRNEPVARWIRRHSPSTRLVHVGRPWSALPTFDLIVTTPQYFLPDQPNILHNHLPMHRINRTALTQAAGQWRARLEHLPRPWTAVLIGGDSGPFVFTAMKGRRLGQQVDALAAGAGGSVLVTNSPRTPARFYSAFLGELSVRTYTHAWAPDQAENPYLAYIALADRFVVTGESMSMLTEAAYTGRPLYIFDPGAGPRWWREHSNFRFKPLSHRLAMRFAPRRMHRDVGNIQRRLVADGRAAWLGEALRAAPRSAVPDDVGRAVERVRALFPAQD